MYSVVFGWNGGVGVDELGHYSTEGLNAEAQWGDVEQQHVFHFAGEYAALDGCAYCHYFVGVDTLVGGFAEEFLYDGLDGGDTGGTADEDDLVDVAIGETCVFHCLTARFEGGLDEVVAQLLEFGAGKGFYKVLRHAVRHGDVWQVDFGLLSTDRFSKIVS